MNDPSESSFLVVKRSMSPKRSVRELQAKARQHTVAKLALLSFTQPPGGPPVATLARARERDHHDRDAAVIWVFGLNDVHPARSSSNGGGAASVMPRGDGCFLA